MPPALSCLPLSQVLRTYLITSISSSPLLLRTSTRILRSMLESRNPLTSIDRNPLLRSLLWHTFYRQFCAGETPSQVARVNAELRAQGYSGVILEYALEVLKDAEGAEASEEKDVGDCCDGFAGGFRGVEVERDGARGYAADERGS